MWILGTQVLKRLGCPHGDQIYIQNEVGREMGCGVGDPPNAKQIFRKKKFMWIYFHDTARIKDNCYD